MTSDTQVWRTDSRMLYLFAEARTTAHALRVLADAVEDQGYDNVVIDLGFSIDDDGVITASALIEEANR